MGGPAEVASAQSRLSLHSGIILLTVSALDKISEALHSSSESALRRFGPSLQIEGDKSLGGQQGLVLRVTNSIGKAFALKLYCPTVTDRAILKDAPDNFRREVRITASLNHKNIVKIYTAGTAAWDEVQRQWKVQEGFPDEGPGSTDILWYYLMDFIPGSDLSAIFPVLRTSKATDGDAATKLSPSQMVTLFEALISQVCAGMYYYHNKGVTHKDIKPSNIRYCAEDSTFIVVDFGFARHMGSPQDKETIVRTEYMDYESIDANDYFKNDMGQFARLLLTILPSLRGEYDADRYRGLTAAIAKGKHEVLSSRYPHMQDFDNCVSPFFLTPTWALQLKLNEYLCPNRFGRFHSKLRIPVSGSILLTREIRAVIDTADFQRLRGVRQLGPTIFVFPGANHTRFEHCLGAYSLSLRYLEKLLALPGFRQICVPPEKSIKLFVLAALLHDVGHYPYSHWVEEVDEFPGGARFTTHEERARRIIRDGTIGQLLREVWDIDPGELADIIVRRRSGGSAGLINSVINSAIDVDKLDYLIRDSIHCGVNYGKGIDVDRLLDSLYVDVATQKVCLTEKGKSCLLSILTCRNIMYQEVYWHKTVRAAHAMFKRFLFEFLQQGLDDPDSVGRYFDYSDDRFISTLYERSVSNAKLNRLIAPFALRDAGRLLYKPLYVFSHQSADQEPDEIKRFFRQKVDVLGYPKLVDLGLRLVKALKARFSGMHELDIILDKTPVSEEHEISQLEGFRIWNTKSEDFENYPEQVKVLNTYLKENRQAYIFCNPEYYDDLRKVNLPDILEEVRLEEEKTKK